MAIESPQTHHYVVFGQDASGDVQARINLSVVGGLSGGTVTSSNITDATTIGRTILTAADGPAVRTAIGAGTSSFDGTWTSLTGKPATFAPIIGATSTTAVAGNDARLTDTRTPTDGTVTDVKVASAAAINADKLADGTTNKLLTATERTKLSGIATGATANSTDATLLSRANHTGTQLAATISDFSAAADARVSAGAIVKPSSFVANAYVKSGATSGTLPTYELLTTGLSSNKVEVQCYQASSTYVRPNYSGPVNFVGSVAPAIRTDGITTGGDNQAVQGLDSWTQTA